MAFIGTPLETLEDDVVEETLNGALVLASHIDDVRAIRLMIEGYLKAMARKKK